MAFSINAMQSKARDGTGDGGMGFGVLGWGGGLGVAGLGGRDTLVRYVRDGS